jgi:hypothetical protein
MRIARRTAWVCVMVALWTTEVSAQSGTDRPISTRAAGATLVGVDFRFDGDAPSEVEFTFDGLAYGVYYDREPMLLTFIRGEQSMGPNDKLVLTDFSLSGWTPLRPFGDSKGDRFDVFLPVGLESDFRRIKRSQDAVEVDAFEYTVVAAGIGLGLSSRMMSGLLRARGLPFFGIANRSFGTDTDTSAILDVAVDWSSRSISSRLGLQIGYSYRWQRWYSDAGKITGDSFDYVSTHHALRMGLSF